MHATYPEASWVQNFGVSGEMHVQGTVVIDSHRHFLQGLVPTVPTEHWVHIQCRLETAMTAQDIALGL